MSSVCRVCMIKQARMMDLFQYNMGNDVANQFLMRFCDVQIFEGDGLSSKICVKCLRCLKSAYKFKTQCEQTDVILRQHARKEFQEKQLQQEYSRIHQESLNSTYNEKKLEDSSSLYSPHGSLHNFENFQKKQVLSLNIITPPIIKEPVLKKIKTRRNATCPVCYQKFESYDDYRLHVRKHDEDIEKPYKCKVCSKSYLCPSRLNQHLFTHAKVKPYVCCVCKKGFNNSSHLKTHMFKHTGEKPYACGLCNKSFNQMPHLKRHMVVHNKI